MDKDTVQNWYFTFGHGHTHGPNGYIIIKDTFAIARQTMFNIYGAKWSMQYSEKEWYDEDGVSQAEKFNLILIDD